MTKNLPDGGTLNRWLTESMEKLEKKPHDFLNFGTPGDRNRARNAVQNTNSTKYKTVCDLISEVQRAAEESGIVLSPIDSEESKP